MNLVPEENRQRPSRSLLVMFAVALLVAIISLFVLRYEKSTIFSVSSAPPEKTISTLAPPRNSAIVIRAKKCQPTLELYDVSQDPSLLCTFGGEPKQFDLFPRSTYLLVLINEMQNSDWSNDFQIIANSGEESRILMSVVEGGTGQAAIRRKIALVDAQ